MCSVQYKTYIITKSRRILFYQKHDCFSIVWFWETGHCRCLNYVVIIYVYIHFFHCHFFHNNLITFIFSTFFYAIEILTNIRLYFFTIVIHFDPCILGIYTICNSNLHEKSKHMNNTHFIVRTTCLTRSLLTAYSTAR